MAEIGLGDLLAVFGVLPQAGEHRYRTAAPWTVSGSPRQPGPDSPEAPLSTGGGAREVVRGELRRTASGATRRDQPRSPTGRPGGAADRGAMGGAVRRLRRRRYRLRAACPVTGMGVTRPPAHARPVAHPRHPLSWFKPAPGARKPARSSCVRCRGKWLCRAPGGRRWAAPAGEVVVHKAGQVGSANAAMWAARWLRARVLAVRQRSTGCLLLPATRTGRTEWRQRPRKGVNGLR